MRTTEDTAASSQAKKKHYVRAGLFCAMLALALVGMGLNMSLEKGD